MRFHKHFIRFITSFITVRVLLAITNRMIHAVSSGSLWIQYQIRWFILTFYFVDGRPVCVLNLTVLSAFNEATKLHPVEFRVTGQVYMIDCKVEVSREALSRNLPRQTAGEHKKTQSKRQVIAPRSKPVTFTTQNLRVRHCHNIGSWSLVTLYVVVLLPHAKGSYSVVLHIQDKARLSFFYCCTVYFDNT